MIPFDAQVFIAFLGRYNADLWPWQVVAVIAMLAAVGLMARPTRARAGWAMGLVALGWVVTGLVFHIQHFAMLNFAAPFHGAAFLVQAGMLLGAGAVAGALTPDRPPRGPAVVLALAGLALYPLVQWAGGAPVASLAIAGLAPTPTAIVTLGLLAMAPGRAAWPVAVVPIAWALAAGAAGWSLGLIEGALGPVAVIAFIAIRLSAIKDDRATAG